VPHRMPARSAGLLPYRRVADQRLELFLVHPGGPLWATKDERAWSVAKGEYDGGEAPLAAAIREFTEELGVAPPEGHRIDLGEVRQAGGKVVRAWAVDAGSWLIGDVASNQFELEWPPRSGRLRWFPEVDRAEWMSVDTARPRMVAAQLAFIDRLEEALPPPPDGPAERRSR
jgi:predicted NUDIX family NTP pyrophosphohydrolase